METRKYIILGNGIAGYSAAKEIRKTDKEGSILIISKESYPTYFRIQLTHLIAKDIDDKVFMSPEDWYEKNSIEVLLKENIKSFHPEERRVVLEDGREFQGEKILLATGASSFIPPIQGVDKKNIFAIRSLDDVKAFNEALKTAEKVTVIGGGLLGLEAAYSIHESGKPVQVVESFSHLLGRQLDTEEGHRLEDRLKEMGMTIYCGHNTQEFLGEDKVEGIRLDNGEEIKTDLVLLSTGIRPNTGLFKESALEVNRGLVVDESLRTSVDQVYAAGDVAEIHSVCLGLWTAGMETGKIAGHNMANPQDLKTYETPKNFTELSIGDIEIFSVGQNKDEGQILTEEEEDRRVRIFLEEDKIVGGILVGNTKAKGKLKKLVFNGANLTEVKEIFPNLS